MPDLADLPFVPTHVITLTEAARLRIDAPLRCWPVRVDDALALRFTTEDGSVWECPDEATRVWLFRGRPVPTDDVLLVPVADVEELQDDSIRQIRTLGEIAMLIGMVATVVDPDGVELHGEVRRRVVAIARPRFNAAVESGMVVPSPAWDNLVQQVAQHCLAEGSAWMIKLVEQRSANLLANRLES